MKRIKRKHWKEVLERLEALEWVVKEMHAEARHRQQSYGGEDERGFGDRHHDGNFDEKRIVDLIVRLVSERLERALAPLPERLGASRPKPERFDERQLIDRIVTLVSERVEQLVVERIGQVMDARRAAGTGEPADSADRTGSGVP